MSDPISGWLRLAKTTKDTTFGSNTKWDSLARANDVKSLPTLLNLPDFVFDNSGPKFLPFCRFAQYNFNIGQNFTIGGLITAGFNNTHGIPIPGLFIGNTGGAFGMMIRYRIGNKVTRYQLVPGLADLPFWPFYNGEVIKGNCSIEFYSWEQADSYQLQRGNSLITSLLNVPIDWNDTSPIIQPDGGLITDFQLPYGNPLPYQFANSGPYNSN